MYHPPKKRQNLKKLLDMGKKQTSQIPNILLSVKDASVAISVSSKMVRLLIASGRLKAVNLGKRMTRISLQELTDFAERQGCSVVLPSSSLPFNNDKRERNKKKPNFTPCLEGELEILFQSHFRWSYLEIRLPGLYTLCNVSLHRLFYFLIVCTACDNLETGVVINKARQKDGYPTISENPPLRRKCST